MAAKTAAARKTAPKRGARAKAKPKKRPARTSKKHSSVEETNKALARRFIDAISRADVDAIVAAYAPDGTCWTAGTMPISGTFGVDQVAAASRGVLTVFPEGLRFTIHAMTAEGDRVAIEAESYGKQVSGKTYRRERTNAACRAAPAGPAGSPRSSRRGSTGTRRRSRRRIDGARALLSGGPRDSPVKPAGCRRFRAKTPIRTGRKPRNNDDTSL